MNLSYYQYKSPVPSSMKTYHIVKDGEVVGFITKFPNSRSTKCPFMVSIADDPAAMAPARPIAAVYGPNDGVPPSENCGAGYPVHIGRLKDAVQIAYTYLENNA